MRPPAFSDDFTAQDANSLSQAAAIGVPGEITATSILVTYWDTDVSCEQVFLHERQFTPGN